MIYLMKVIKTSVSLLVFTQLGIVLFFTFSVLSLEQSTLSPKGGYIFLNNIFNLKGCYVLRSHAEK